MIDDTLAPTWVLCMLPETACADVYRTVSLARLAFQHCQLGSAYISAMPARPPAASFCRLMWVSLITWSRVATTRLWKAFVCHGPTSQWRIGVPRFTVAQFKAQSKYRTEKFITVYNSTWTMKMGSFWSYPGVQRFVCLLFVLLLQVTLYLPGPYQAFVHLVWIPGALCMFMRSCRVGSC